MRGVQLSIRLPKDVHQFIKNKAAEGRRSINNQINLYIDLAIEALKENKIDSQESRK